MHGGRRFAHAADKFARQYGGVAGNIMQAAAVPISALGGPTTGIITGAAGKGLATYAELRNQAEAG